MDDLIDEQARTVLETLAGVHRCTGECGTLLPLPYTLCVPCALAKIDKGELVLRRDDEGHYVIVSFDPWTSHTERLGPIGTERSSDISNNT